MTWLLLLSFTATIWSLWLERICSNPGDPPDYDYHQQLLINISKQQPWILDTWKMPDPIHFNTAMGVWPLNAMKYNSTSELFIMGAPGYGCRSNCYTFYSVIKLINTTQLGNYKRFKPIHKLSEDGIFLPTLVGDPRIYKFQEKTFMIFIPVEISFQEPYVAEILYNDTLDILYFKLPTHKLSIEHEMGHRQQKNWSPLIYNFKSNHPFYYNPKLSSRVFYVYSIFPHRIVDANETVSPVLTKTHTLCLTEIQGNINEIWQYGPIHGGTNSVLIDTIYGPRYLAIFHSQGNYMAPWCVTYFMGAYIFEAEPPFAITHISHVPIFPYKLYDEFTDGWAFKAIDYIVFPMNIVLDGELLYVSMGRNDKSGWMMVLNSTGLVKSLMAVNSVIHKDRFFEQTSYTILKHPD